MLLQILKKDMLKRKGVNIILFLFITLSTIFLASSINNIMIVGSAVEYYMDYANVPDSNIVMNSDKDIKKINQWLDKQKDLGVIKTYDYNQLVEISDKSVMINKDGKSEELNNRGTSLFLQTQDVDYCKVFDLDGKEIKIKDGEIAIAVSLMNYADLKIGDTLTVHDKGITKELIIKEAVKDAAFGNEMVGMSRFIISENDFYDFSKESTKLGLYYVETTDIGSFHKELSNQGFTGVMNTISIDTYKMVYSFDMIIAGLLILIGICLILIALLVLRFTLVFSLEEQYQEIGILKAIGLRDFVIKKLYLIKYLAIVTVGAILGAIISVPVSQMMIDGVNQNMIMASTDLNFFVNILCAGFIIVLVLLFCYLCTRKLNKVSAITAIRGGYTGERFHDRRGIHLSKTSRLSVPFYLGLNDIMSHLTRYVVLIITFCISFILITIPLNTINTMQSDEMILKFYLNPESSVFVRKIEQNDNVMYRNSKDLLNGIHRVEKEMKDKGYDAKLTALPIYFINYNTKDNPSKFNIMSLQLIGQQDNFVKYEDGEAPLLENEVAFSRTIMKENNWAIGDYVKATIDGKQKNLIISGIYSDYMQMGKSARLSPKIDSGQEVMFDYWTIMVKMTTEDTQEEVAKTMQKEFPDYEWKTAQELVDQNVGGIQESLNQMLIPMTGMLCGVIMLITLLMEKLFITREKGEIAMMKSIGFTYQTIRNWQLIRMILVVVASMIISIPLSLLSNYFVLRPVFAIMGADVAIQVNPLQAYLIYPGILLIGIILATALAVRGIKKINIKEMNNLE